MLGGLQDLRKILVNQPVSLLLIRNEVLSQERHDRTCNPSWKDECKLGGHQCAKGAKINMGKVGFVKGPTPLRHWLCHQRHRYILHHLMHVFLPRSPLQVLKHRVRVRHVLHLDAVTEVGDGTNHEIVVFYAHAREALVHEGGASGVCGHRSLERFLSRGADRPIGVVADLLHRVVESNVANVVARFHRQYVMSSEVLVRPNVELPEERACTPWIWPTHVVFVRCIGEPVVREALPGRNL